MRPRPLINARGHHPKRQSDEFEYLICFETQISFGHPGLSILARLYTLNPHFQ